MIYNMAFINLISGIKIIKDYADEEKEIIANILSRAITNITIPNGVTAIGNDIFNDCTSLTNITIPNSVTSIGDSAFYNCTSLTNITIPNSVTTIGNYAFYNCTSLTSITINKASGSISGSPWGATKATITWNG